MAEADLRLLLRTIADTSGAEKTSAALRRVQQDATQSLTGVQAQAAAAGSSLLKMGAAAGIAGVATDRFIDFLGGSITVMREHERISRAVTASYGQQTATWVKFAQQLSATTGFTSDAILEAALSARTLSNNYGLSIEQTQKLIRASADLARIRGIGVEQAFERVQSAIRGEAESSEYLGLTLNETYLKNNALNGSLKNTWETLSDAQKAQIRYNELLKQSADFAGLASSSVNSLDSAFNKAATSASNLQIELGKLTAPAVILGLNLLADAMDVVAQGGFIGRGLEQLRQAAQSPSSGGGRGGFDADRPLKQAISDTRSRLRALNEDLYPVQTRPAAELAALVAQIAREQALMDQIDAAARDVILAQQESNRLQRESVQLAAEEARIKLSLLPAQQRLAELQRQTTEQQIRAQLAALPATERLDDLRFEEQRLRLVLQQRGIASEEKSAARRELRALGRGPLAAAELEALVAGRAVTLAGRAGTRVGLAASLQDIADQRALAGVSGSVQRNALVQAVGAADAQGAQQVLADAVRQGLEAGLNLPIQVTVNVTTPDGRTETYQELIEAAGQAQMPPVVRVSGVRR